MQKKKKLVLAGSGEYTEAMIDVDKFLLTEAPGKKIAILPTAAGREAGSNDWTVRGVDHFNKLDAKPVGINVINKDQANDQEYVDKLKGADFIYFSGGDPGYLRETLEGTALWKKILSLYEAGSILAGSSAGAMVMGPYVLSNAQRLESRREKPLWEESFGLINYSIIPHYDYIQKKLSFLFNTLIKTVPSHIRNRLIGIDEDTIIYVIDSHHAQVMGHGKVHVFEDGDKKVYEPGDSFDLK